MNNHPISKVLDQIHLITKCQAKKSGREWKGLCPAHDDHNPSLSISQGDDGRVLLHCHAGCPVEKVVAALGLTMADLMPPQSSGPRSKMRQKSKPTPTIYATLNDAVKAATWLVKAKHDSA